ncbi:SRPBCC family protein [Nocardia sp. alder85J]|uniref:SRPBCC family protein n=1 Tax=Nocardia sp. alder85J TaxID=2862949 RepID=UPI001CD525F7|nr:SRPBCC family protein [Nocardia sp. alder85J]MCX4092326.1 SRPBCC family protein [Nocardia sp. alder85J]
MTHIASATATSTAAPAAFFAKWADMATWPEWNADTEWVRLDGPFVQGATGTLKPAGGPKVSFEVATLTETEFVDVSRLPGGRLTFAHRVEVTPAGTEVSVSITLTGPLRWFWRKVMGADLAAGVGRDLDALVGAAEALSAAGSLPARPEEVVR